MTNDRTNTGNPLTHPGDKRGDLQVGLPSYDRGARGVVFPSLLAHNDTRRTSGFDRCSDTSGIYRSPLENTHDAGEPDGAILLIIMFILIFFFGV